ncbi:MAG: T9SS type A sorting domain-containing protein, partial [Firmicutes bacterium]|nr:T9SS type A sorting domain-containing protein [Bacillota bacterium]
DRKKREKFFTIAPNPNQGKFQILHNGISDYIDSEFVLFSALGQTIRKGRVSNPFIDISEQPNGIYFLKMAQECLKVIKY